MLQARKNVPTTALATTDDVQSEIESNYAYYGATDFNLYTERTREAVERAKTMLRLNIGMAARAPEEDRAFWESVIANDEALLKNCELLYAWANQTEKYIREFLKAKRQRGDTIPAVLEMCQRQVDQEVRARQCTEHMLSVCNPEEVQECKKQLAKDEAAERRARWLLSVAKTIVK